jgi:transposase
MRQTDETKYVKRTQKDYTYSFKLQVVQEVEQGELGIKAAQRKYGIQGDGTVRKWLEKHGNFDLENKAMLPMPKSTEAKLLELEQKVKLLEKQKKRLEYQVEQADKKAIIFDIMIDLAEKEYKIPIRKKSLPEQSTSSEKNTKKL